MRRATIALAFLALTLAGCGGSGGGVSLDLHAPGPHVSPAEQAALDTQAYALGNRLCAHPLPRAKVPAEAKAAATVGNLTARPQYEALKAALRDHPYDTVTVSFTLADPEPGEQPVQSKDITVVELAKTDLEPPLPRNACGTAFEQQLQELIDAAG